MSNQVTDQFTRNPFVEKCMSYIPDDPVTQTQYLYFLTCFVFFGLMGYALAAWYNLFSSFTWTGLFTGIFMTAIGLISLFGLKQTRNSYLYSKEMYGNKPQDKKLDSIDDMLKEFEQPKDEEKSV